MVIGSPDGSFIDLGRGVFGDDGPPRAEFRGDVLGREEQVGKMWPARGRVEVVDVVPDDQQGSPWLHRCRAMTDVRAPLNRRQVHEL